MRRKSKGVGGRTLKQRNLEESFKQCEGGCIKRKERSPGDIEEVTKKERAERIENQQSPFARSNKINRSPPQQKGGEEKKEKGEMNEILNKLKEMTELMMVEKEERKKMREEWEKRWNTLEANLDKKFESEAKKMEGRFKEEKEERKRVGLNAKKRCIGRRKRGKF